MTCIESIKTQPGEWRCVLVDDGSTDGTTEILEQACLKDSRFGMLRSDTNLGAAHSRWLGIEHGGIEAHEVVVCVDMDDYLAPRVVTPILEREYADGADVTLGRFRFHRLGAGWSQPAYDAETIRERAYRRVGWRAWPVRTFRARFAQGIDPSYFKDRNGEWVRCCTDLAIMFCVLERATDVRMLQHVLYVYRRPSQRPRTPKAAVNRWLRSLPVMEPMS